MAERRVAEGIQNEAGMRALPGSCSVTQRELTSDGACRPTIIKAYGTVRGSAARHVGTALPQVGKMVQKYAA